MFLKTKFLIGFLIFSFCLQAQPDRWLQKVEYKMNIDFNAKKPSIYGYPKSYLLQ